MAKGSLFKLLDGYEAPDDVGGRSITGKRFVSRSYSGSIIKQKQRIKQMRFFAFIGGVARAFSYTSTKVYGAASLTFGILTLLVHLIKDYLVPNAALPIASLIVGIFFSLIAIPFLLADKPFSLFFQENAVADYILFEFFCIKRTYPHGDERTFPTAVAVIFAAILGLIGYFIPAWVIAAAIGAFVFAYISIVSPEFAFFTSQLFLPYLHLIPNSEMIFAAVVGVASLSFLRKALSGKRVIFFEQYDLLLFLMLLCVMISGISAWSADSFMSAVLMLILSLGYFLASNTVTNRRLADCALNAVVVSSIVPSFVAIGQMIYYTVSGDFLGAIARGIPSTFSSAEVFSVFLVTAITLGAALAKQSRKTKKILYVSVLVLNTVALLLTGEIFAILALIIAVGAYHALKARALAVLVLPVLMLLPYALFIIPDEALAPVFDFLPDTPALAELYELWRGALSAAGENMLFGIGVGEAEFSAYMAKLGITGAPDASNLFLTVMASAGLPALIFFVLLLLVRLRHRAIYYQYVKESQVSRVAPMLSVAAVVLLCLGATDYIWSDFSMYYLFFCVFGLGSATLRVAKKEHDDRVLYYEDTRRTYSSSVSVHIK